MSSSTGLKNAPLRQGFEFNWIFLVELVLCGVLTLFFIFYFNRVLAAILSYGVRSWTWHRYRVYVDVRSFQFSILAGRVFFKELRYHGNNETILIQSGYITWRYWLRNVRQIVINRSATSSAQRNSKETEINSKGHDGQGESEKIEEESSKLLSKLPCRLIISLKGVEWFIYNRSLAYDSIASSLAQASSETSKEGMNTDQESSNSDFHQSNHSVIQNNISNNVENPVSFDAKKIPVNPRENNTSSYKPKFTETKYRNIVHKSQDLEQLPFILRSLPIQVECEKAAVVIGNHNTQSVLIVKIEKAAGIIDASDSSSKLDLYRQSINVNFEYPTIQIKPNNDYKEEQTESGLRAMNGLRSPLEEEQQHQMYVFVRQQYDKVLRLLQDIMSKFKSQVISVPTYLDGVEESTENQPHLHGWKGLSRYLDESRQDDNFIWSTAEYARVSTILESPSASMEVFWDSVGFVQEKKKVSKQPKNISDNINGDIPPEWGINLSFRSTIINYGPWADRQRVDIQKVFFPNLCEDAIKAKNLASGELRVPTNFKINIEFDEESVLRIPTKEESKNWKWTKKAGVTGIKPNNRKENSRYNRKSKIDADNHGPKARPFGWLDFKFVGRSTVYYNIDIVAGTEGFSSNLDIGLPSVEITTSVNHGLLWKSCQNRISCDLSQPLKWNGPRAWRFDIISRDLELFFLREHVFLLTDLIDDWSSGPPQEYLTFCPLQIFVSFHLEDSKVYFNVNDSNIINNPSDFDGNTFIVLSGSEINAKISIPLDNYRPHRHEIQFNIDIQRGNLSLLVPHWNTHATFLAMKELSTARKVTLKGNFQYCSTVSTSNTDTLMIDVNFYSLSVKTYGFAIRLLLKIKDNYLGEDIHFKTLEEYQTGLDSNERYQKPYKTSNDLDIIIGLHADECKFYLPSNLYAACESICVQVANISSDIRFNNYYMDCQLDFSPIHFSQANQSFNSKNFISDTQLFIDGMNLHENRLFGLPPSEPTYVCNRDISLGFIKGECTTEFLRRLIAGFRAFSFSLDDNENVLPSISEESLHEVIFLRATIDSIDVWLHLEDHAFTFSTKKISITSNNWAGPCYSKKQKILIPGLKLGCIDTELVSGYKSKMLHPAEADALLQSSISIVIIEKKSNFEKDRQLQQEHVQCHDQRTNRCSFLLRKDFLNRSAAIPVRPPTIKPPPMPAPVFSRGSVNNNNGSLSSKLTGSKSSFLSLSNSNIESIINQSLPNDRSSRNNIEQTQKNSQLTKTYFGNQYRPPLKELSFSDQQSSLYSTINESNALSQAFATFSNSHIEPHFSLEGVEINNSNLPKNILERKEQVLVSENQKNINSLEREIPKEGKMHTSYVISFTDPVEGFLNSKTISVITKLLKAMLPININDLLDELQIKSMNEIINNSEEKPQQNTSFDLGLHVPSINLRFLNPMIVQSTKDECNDQFNLSISRLAITLRSETKDTEEAKIKISKLFLLYVAISSGILIAKENAPEISNPPATISFIFEDFISWANLGEKQTLSARLKFFELLIYSCRVRNAASLLHRIRALKAKYEHEFSTLYKEQEVRIRLLAYLVTTSGQQITEPLFLTRPSYVLRSATGHLRTHISWTIISRLHHIYNCLDHTAQNHIASRCSQNSETLPKDAKQRTLSSLARWRSWDLSNMDNCAIISKIFGPNSDSGINSAAENYLQISLEIEEFRLVIDPGPKQNSISIYKASINLQKSIGSSDSTMKKLPDNQKASIIVAEILLYDFSVICNWELHEMARDILHTSNQIDDSLDVLVKTKFEDDNEISSSEIDSNFHFIFETHKASLHIDTINLRKTFIINEIKASFIKIKDMLSKGQVTSSLIVTAKDATSNVKSHSQDLCLTQLQLPSICISYQTEICKINSSNVLSIAANCQELDFILRQDLLALAEVMNLLIIDEIAQAYELTRIISRTTPSKLQTDPRVTDISFVPKISIALFLNRYHVSMQLLHPLRYEVFGHVARASVTAQLNKEIIFDFDIKDHAHDIKTSASQSDQIRNSSLEMPPTNGRVTLHMFDEDNVLSVFVSIEPVILDAYVVHTLVTTTNRPEVLDMIEKVRNDFGSTKSQLQNIIYRDKPVQNSRPTQDKVLLFDARLTLAGFGIIANKLSTEKHQNTARLDFHLGCVQLVAMNRVDANRAVGKFPQLRITLTQVMFDLARWDINKVSRSCGSLTFDAFLTVSSRNDEKMQLIRSCHFKSNYLKINLFSDTVSTVLDVLSHLQNKIKDIDLPLDNNYLRKIRKSKPLPMAEKQKDKKNYPSTHKKKSYIIYSFELSNIQISWLVEKSTHHFPTGTESEDLVLLLRRMEFSTKKINSAQLRIENLQLQMVPSSQNKTLRSLNSALLPEVIFNVGYVSMRDNLQLAFQAGGKSLDLRLTSRFMIPVSAIKKSIVSSIEEFRKVSSNWSLLPGTERKQPFLGKKHLESLSIDADFAGAVVHLCNKSSNELHDHTWERLDLSQERKTGKFSTGDAKSVDSTTVLRSPGIAFKIKYKDCGIDDLSLNAEVKVDASSNILYPSVVPIIMEISSTVKKIVSNEVNKETESSQGFQKPMDTDQLCPTDLDQTNPINTDQITVLERAKLNLGLRICRQEFGLSCQPIGRVAATAQFEDIYIVVNTVRSNENNQNFAASAIISGFKASVQHVYSREATGSFEIEDLVISLMNSKHIGSTNGLAAILRTSPIKTSLNAKQLHDFLLFREIWMPPEIRRKTQTHPLSLSSVQPQTIFAQKHQHVAAISSFPWNVTLIITGLDAQLDLGQAIGKSALKISKIWLSYKKNSAWDQNLCLGIENIDVESTGRMSGLFALEDFKLRTSIKWLEHELMNYPTPLIQGSIIFKNLSTKASFDYQAFLVANIKSLHFLMFNTFTENSGTDDCLTAILEAEAVQAFCTTASSSHALALYQAFQKLIQEKLTSFETSLSEIENFLHRTSPAPVTSTILHTKVNSSAIEEETWSADSPIYLKTDVIVMLKAVNVGVFPTTFLDHQVFKLEALDIETRFGVTMDNGKIHSILGLTLGQLRIGLAAVKNHETSKSLGDISVEEVVNNVTGSRGGTILKVPEVEAVMQTWQVPKSNQIEYIFKSLFGGKVEVGWNYSRISYIRSMWAAHTKALGQRLGKPLPMSAVRITGVPDGDQLEENDGKQRKITAEVNVPQSKYNYSPLEPPIIETPQLKDMGEATPPMEWIGLHRDRLPNLTHQIFIVPLNFAFQVFVSVEAINPHHLTKEFWEFVVQTVYRKRLTIWDNSFGSKK